VSVIAKWQPGVVVEAVKEELVENMELACKVVEVDARRRLLAIQDPKFGRGYRRILAMFKLISFVEVGAKAVIGHIGIPKAEKGSDYGFWIEIGSKTAPAHPWLRPALLNNKREILKLLGGQ
jgi:hypothetical protein